MDFEIVGDIVNIEPIAVSRGIREVSRLQKAYGQGNWRKLKGFANVRLKNGAIPAEVH